MRLILIVTALLIAAPAYAANELPSIGAPNGTVRATPSAIIVPEDPDVPGGAGCVVGSTGCNLNVTVSGLVTPASNSFTNITTATDTNVKASAGVFAGIVVNTGGVGSMAIVYNDADGVCSLDPIGSFSTTAQASLVVNATASTGICVTTTGGTPADITILWR